MGIMGNLTREEILARKMGQDVVQLPDGSGTVTVRGLNRREALTASGIEDHYERDAYLVASGLVDPAMTVDDVKAWGESDDTNTIEVVSRAIGGLSGMVEGAGKSGVSRPRRRSRS
jgi:hypothetical protein